MQLIVPHVAVRAGLIDTIAAMDITVMDEPCHIRRRGAIEVFRGVVVEITELLDPRVRRDVSATKWLVPLSLCSCRGNLPGS
jgi:hypothetical protein